MGSVLNFITLFNEKNYPEWCFAGPAIQKIYSEYSHTLYPTLKNGYKNYLIIEPSSGLNGLTKFIETNNSIEFFDFCKKNDINILIACISDPPTEDNYNLLVKKLKELQIYNLCKFITSNLNINNTETFSFHFFIEQYFKNKNIIFNKKTDLGYFSEEIKVDELNIFRNKKFLSFNKTIEKQHRYSLFHDYLTNDFSDSYFSFLELENNFCKPYQSNLYEFDFYLKKIPIELDTNGSFNFRTHNTFKKDLFLDSCIHLVTETSFHHNELFISEKIMKPILNYQPFIVLGPAYYLKELKKFGFKTFSDLWDESYDEIQNPSDRYFKLSELILHLNKKSIDELNKLYQELKEICIFNRNHFYSLNIDSFDEYLNNL
jgi:hypothetical protein